jgi:hypothetical protein
MPKSSEDLLLRIPKKYADQQLLSEIASLMERRAEELVEPTDDPSPVDFDFSYWLDTTAAGLRRVERIMAVLSEQSPNGRVRACDVPDLPTVG